MLVSGGAKVFLHIGAFRLGHTVLGSLNQDCEPGQQLFELACGPARASEGPASKPRKNTT